VSKASEHRKTFRDIVRGYSATEYQDNLVFIRHLTPHDQVELEDITDLYKSKAQSRGLPTEEETLLMLKEEETWTDEDEGFIFKKKEFIDRLLEGKKKLVLKSAQDKQNALIDRERALLQTKEKEKSDLLGNTCERYAEQRTHDFYILRSFYKDKSMSTPLYTEQQYDDLTQAQVSYLITTYNKIFNSFSEDGIQYLILEEFYSPYLSFAEDSMQFYGKPFCELTYNQVRMIVYTRIFKNIFDNNSNIPEKIRKDPKALLDYGSVSDEEKEKMKDKFESSDGATIVGAKQEDYEYLGIKRPQHGVSLHDQAKKKGGKLSMKDMMKLSGVT
jgi:hypothetical protein